MRVAFPSVCLLVSAVTSFAACGGSSDDNTTNVPSGAGQSAGGASNVAGANATSGATATGGSPVTSAGAATTAGANNAGAAATGGSAAGGQAGAADSGVAGAVASAGSAGSAGTSSSDCAATPIDPAATAEAKKLLCYLYGISGKQVLSGQQETSWSSPQADIDYYVTTVNKHPAILGGDYLYTDGAKPGNNTSVRAKAYWDAGGLTMMRFHMGAPPLADTYDNAKGSVANFDNVTKSGTDENKSLNSKLDYLAGELKFLQDAKVPVLMVLYHEVDKFGWFWWSKGTGAQFVTLWKYSVDYVQKKGVHNVLWVLGYGHDGAVADFWPGKAYVDLGGIDEYDKGTQPFTDLYNGTKSVVGATAPIPLHETGTIPQPSAMFPSTAPWLMWNVWAGYENSVQESYTWNTADTIKSAYADSHTVTRETLPSLK